MLKIGKGDRGRFVSLLVIMTTIIFVVTITTILILYETYFQKQREQLITLVNSQKYIYESVARFDSKYSREDNSEGWRGATISQIKEAFSKSKNFGETGEFTLGTLEGNMINFIIESRQGNENSARAVPLDNKNAEPMRRALQGETGVIVDLDYRGVMVLAAHAPIDLLNVGLVAKIDLAEIRAPFIKAGIVTILFALFLNVIGALIFRRVTNPIIELLENRVADSENLVKERTAELEEKEILFRSLLESAPIATIIVNVDGEIILTNDQALNLFGYEADELIGNKIEILIPNKFHDVHISHREKYVRHPETLDMHRLRDLVAQKKDGSVFPVEISISQIETDKGILVASSIRDITDRKRAEVELRSSEQRLAMAMEIGNLVAWDRDLRSGITKADTFYEKILGFEPGEIDQNSDSWKNIVHPDDASDVPKMLGLFLEGKIPEFRVHYRAYTKNRNLKWIETIADIAERDEEGNPVRITGTQRDITEQKEAEITIQEKLEELEKFNQLAVGRELRMIELKKEINELLINNGKDAEYNIIE